MHQDFFGNRGARWCLCPEGLSETSVVYCVGVGEEISFDLELIKQFGIRAHAFDPTPRSIQWVRAQTLPERFEFHAYGVADFDGTCKFLPPENPGHVSHTILPRQSPWLAIEVPVYRLPTIMKMLGHSEIDLLKMNIEGAEYGVLADLLACKIRLQQILVEFSSSLARNRIRKNAHGDSSTQGRRLPSVSCITQRRGVQL